MNSSTGKGIAAPVHDLGLADRVAIVTGGSRGIGKAVVSLLASCGTHVVVNYLKDETAAAAAVNLAQSHNVKALAIQADVSRLSDAERLLQETVEHFGRVDFLICNAGIWEGAPVESISEELWDRTLEINLKGTWSVCRAAVPIMKQQRFGRIVIVSSTAGQRGEAYVSNYAASKGGQISFTKSLAPELGLFCSGSRASRMPPTRAIVARVSVAPIIAISCGIRCSRVRTNRSFGRTKKSIASNFRGSRTTLNSTS